MIIWKHLLAVGVVRVQALGPVGMEWQSSPSGKGRRRFGGPDAQVARTAGKTRPLTQAASPRNVAFILCSMYCAQIHDFIEIRQVYDTYYLYFVYPTSCPIY